MFSSLHRMRLISERKGCLAAMVSTIALMVIIYLIAPHTRATIRTNDLTRRSLQQSVQNQAKEPPQVPEWMFMQRLAQTTRLIYKGSGHARFWLEQPPPRIYVYDTLPRQFSDVEYISKCIDHHYLDRSHINGGNIPIKNNCRWYPKICSDTKDDLPRHHRGKVFITHRFNFNSDVALVEWFKNYPARTYDPNEADLFVVPYPYKSASLCPEVGLNNTVVHEKIIPNLPHLNEETRKRHLWISGCDWVVILGDNIREEFLHGITLTLGPSPCKPLQEKPCPVLVTPYLDTAPELQPDELMSQPYWENMMDRPNALASKFTLPKNHKYRIKFYSEKAALGSELHGKKIALLEMNKDRVTVGKDLTDRSQLYSESIFCAILPGDLPTQKRFFDVILNGCIPLVPLFYESSNALPYPSSHDNPTWFVVTNVLATYPYAKDLQFRGDRVAGVDWLNDMMVTFNATCGAPCARKAMDRVLSDTSELQRLQGNIKKYAPLFCYGLEHNMYRHVDAFYALLVNIRHYLYSLRAYEEGTNIQAPQPK